MCGNFHRDPVRRVGESQPTIEFKAESGLHIATAEHWAKKRSR